MGEVIVRFGADTAGLNAGVAAAASQIRGFGAQVAAVGAVAGIAMVGIGAAAAHMAGDFQFSINKLYTTAGEAKTSLGAVSSGILQMSVDVGTGAQKMADAMYYVESAGFHGQQGLDVLRIAAEGAKTENADLNDVVRALTASMNAYGPALATPAETMNTLISATAHGSMQLQDLTTGLKNVLPAAAHFGISLEDAAAAMAVMTTQGDNAASAGTHLRQVILSLEAPAKPARDALAAIGLTTAQIAAEMKVSLPGALQLITDKLKEVYGEGSPAYNQALKDISGGNRQMMGMLETTGQHMNTFQQDVANMTAQTKAGGQAIMGWAEVQKTFNFQLDRGKAALEAFMINLGGKLLPVLTPIVQGFADAIPKVQAFFDELTTNKIPDYQIPAGIRDLKTTFDNIGKAWQNTGAIIAGDKNWQAIGTSVDNAASAIARFSAVLSNTNAAFSKTSAWSSIVSDIGSTFNQTFDQIDKGFTALSGTLALARGQILTTKEALQMLGKDNINTALSMNDANQLIARGFKNVTDASTGLNINLAEFVSTGGKVRDVSLTMGEALALVGKTSGQVLTAADAVKLLGLGVNNVSEGAHNASVSMKALADSGGMVTSSSISMAQALKLVGKSSGDILTAADAAKLLELGVKSVSDSAHNADIDLKQLAKTKVKPNVDASDITALSQNAQNTRSRLQDLNTHVKPTVDTGDVTNAQMDARHLEDALRKAQGPYNTVVTTGDVTNAQMDARNLEDALRKSQGPYATKYDDGATIQAGATADQTRQKLLATNGPYYPDVDASSVLAAGGDAQSTYGMLLALNGSSVWSAYVNTYETTYIATIGGPGSGPGNARAGGGLITEPVVGVGLRTGERWTFGENGNEMVVPLTGSKASGGGQAGVSGGKHDARIAVALERLNDLLSNPQRVSEYQVAQAVGKLLVNGVR